MTNASPSVATYSDGVARDIVEEPLQGLVSNMEGQVLRQQRQMPFRTSTIDTPITVVKRPCYSHCVFQLPLITFQHYRIIKGQAKRTDAVLPRLPKPWILQ